MTTWYQPLRGVRSLGSQSRRPGSLAGLHAVRQENLSQFFTGDDLARVVWELAVGLPAAALDRKVSVLDNSVGAGRLLQFANPERHSIAGADVHGPSIEALMVAAEAAGFDADFINAGMETIAPRGFDSAVINPPFSIHLDAPTLTPFTCTTWGKYGPSSAANSHAYALHQALDAAKNVVAVLPATYADQAFADPTLEMEDRLRALIELPAGCFAHEGTQVDVALLVFGKAKPGIPAQRIRLDRLDGPLPRIDGMDLPENARPPRPLSRRTVEASTPSITGEVTGGTRVRIVHNGRRIGFKFDCALMEAKVMNRVLEEPVAYFEGHRYPDSVRYIGQGKLDVEVILLQHDPLACLRWLELQVEAVGGVPAMDPGLRNYLIKRIRRYAVESTPFGHVVKGGGITSDGLATVRRKRMLNPKVWGSPLLKAGDNVEISARDEGDYLVRVGQAEVVLREDEVRADFELPQLSTEDGWRDAYASREAKFPELARSIRAHLISCGAIAVAGWDYQVEDMVELLMGRHGLSAWRMGCGKGRLAIALALAGGRHNGIVVESRLVDELVIQLQESGVDTSLWQVITTPEQCDSLRQINIVSYNTLRRPVVPGAGRRTFARLLRRRLSLVAADEAHLLRNTETEQSRALAMLSPRRRFSMTGTPQANYVQDMLPLTQWTYGDGTAVQPYGRHHPFVEARLWQSMSAAGRGTTVFAERHVVTEWVTREWEDGMQVGAKRQVPKIAKIEVLRDWAAPLLKRRHEKEPKVRAHFNTPDPIITPVTVDWDPAHLAHYLTIADLFTEWYRKAHDDASKRGKNLNLVALLARIGAVERACNTPQFASQGKVDVPTYGPLTSKQRYVLSRLKAWTAEGHKSICYTDSPTSVGIYVRELEKAGIEAVAFHGKQTITARTRDMNRRFRYGDAPVMVASKDCVEKGLNIWQASRGILAARDWSHTKEDQMMRRLLRPQQTKLVEFECVNLRGSIDEYQQQMTLMKGDSAGAAIDFLTPETEHMEFVHLDQILARFVDDLKERAGFEGHNFREQLRGVALAA
ncbi:SNF2-related protein [Stenotrophomonas maltophilia]|uniref:SNF2-related protein n=1 Tax=Stenotrophomonas maltophilia TaxID=40324 RepID=UPI0039C2F0A8